MSRNVVIGRKTWEVLELIIPLHTLVAGYYDIPSGIRLYSTAIVKFLYVSVTLFAVSVTSCLLTETTDTVSETHR